MSRIVEDNQTHHVLALKLQSLKEIITRGLELCFSSTVGIEMCFTCDEICGPSLPFSILCCCNCG
jgi:hypothetical protein